MRSDLLDYELPAGSIAKHPCPARDGARMLVLDPRTAVLADLHVHDFPRLVPAGALVVVNDTKVVPARLVGRKAETGGRIELLLVKKLQDAASPHGLDAASEHWLALARGLRPFRDGLECTFGGGLRATATGRPGNEGLVEVRLFTEGRGSVRRAIEAEGQVPLPPYLRRPSNAEDRVRYQTVYARVPGAIAAPTAGLHLTPEVLDSLRGRAHMGALTLHIGLGTFAPVKVADFDQHPMHAERFEISEQLRAQIATARARGAPVIAVGTTVVRALETAADPHCEGHVRTVHGDTRLLIQPGYTFRVVDGLLTNFHLPRSTLLALVAAFAGRERVLAAYREAVRRGYRFYSYGDAMWIPARATSQDGAPCQRDPSSVSPP